MNVHSMKLHKEPFDLIKSRIKTIELRLYDEKRRLIKIGDCIEFLNTGNNEIIAVLVKNIHVFNDFKELYSKFDKISMGYLESEEANPEDMEQYYFKEDIEKYGVVGIEISLMTRLEHLQYLYKIDRDRRIDNTVKLFKEVAEECMEGKEKEEFLNNLK